MTAHRQVIIRCDECGAESEPFMGTIVGARNHVGWKHIGAANRDICSACVKQAEDLYRYKLALDDPKTAWISLQLGDHYIFSQYGGRTPRVLAERGMMRVKVWVTQGSGCEVRTIPVMPKGWRPKHETSG